MRGIEEGYIMSNLIIRRETPVDFKSVEHLTMRAFWNIHSPGNLFVEDSNNKKFETIND